MIESELIDCRKGEPHVTPEQVADVNIGTYSSDDCVLTTGNRLRAELITNNSVRLFDGVMVYGGLRDVIPVNKYYDVAIDNGTQGKNRNDIIVRRYSKEEGTIGKASSEFSVVKGTPTTGTAIDPDIAVTDIRAGSLTHDMLLYRVKIEGLNVVAVEQLFEVIPTNKDLSDKLSGIKATKKSYSMTLDYNTYAQTNIGYIEIPQSDIDKLGVPISAMFKGNSSAPGNAYLSVGNDNKVYGYALCVDGTGTLIVTFLNI